MRISLALRITPIYMGSTMEQDYYNIYNEDHPHIHGEHLSVYREMNNIRGSPPYTWGALNRLKITEVTLRITPIYMGSTQSAG